MEVSLGALRSVKHDTLSKNIQKWLEFFFLDWNLQLYIVFYIHKCMYIYIYIYILWAVFFRLSLGWTRTAGRKSFPFHWQIPRMVKFPASYVSSLEGTSLEMNMSPEKGTISKRKVVFQSLLLRGCYVDFFGSQFFIGHLLFQFGRTWATSFGHVTWHWNNNKTPAKIPWTLGSVLKLNQWIYENL